MKPSNPGLLSGDPALRCGIPPGKTKRSRIEVKVSKSSITTLFGKLEFTDYTTNYDFSNEIARGAMKSSPCSDEIKSVLLPTKSDFITK